MLQKKDDKKAAPAPDRVTQQLRAAMARKRPSLWKAVVVLLLIVAVPLGLWLWWTYPRGEEAALMITAFDALAVNGEKVTLRARLQPQKPGDSVRLDGREIRFAAPAPLLLPPDKSQFWTARTGPDGEAAVEREFPAEPSPAPFVARYQGPKSAAEYRAAVYRWPAQSNLAVVEAASLSKAGADDWARRNLLDLPAADGAALALRAMQERKYRVVYLAIEHEPAFAYRKMRGWLENQFVAFPPGPVVGGAARSRDERQKLLRNLAGRFQGTHLYVTATPDHAQTARGEGLITILVGAHEAANQIIAAKSWSELPLQIPQKAD